MRYRRLAGIGELARRNCGIGGIGAWEVGFGIRVALRVAASPEIGGALAWGGGASSRVAAACRGFAASAASSDSWQPADSSDPGATKQILIRLSPGRGQTVVGLPESSSAQVGPTTPVNRRNDPPPIRMSGALGYYPALRCLGRQEHLTNPTRLGGAAPGGAVMSAGVRRPTYRHRQVPRDQSSLASAAGSK